MFFVYTDTLETTCSTYTRPGVATQVYSLNAEQGEEHLKHTVFKEAVAR